MGRQIFDQYYYEQLPTAVTNSNAKTLFLLGIWECRKGVYFDGSKTTNLTDSLDIPILEIEAEFALPDLDDMAAGLAVLV